MCLWHGLYLDAGSRARAACLIFCSPKKRDAKKGARRLARQKTAGFPVLLTPGGARELAANYAAQTALAQNLRLGLRCSAASNGVGVRGSIIRINCSLAQF